MLFKRLGFGLHFLVYLLMAFLMEGCGQEGWQPAAAKACRGPARGCTTRCSGSPPCHGEAAGVLPGIILQWHSPNIIPNAPTWPRAHQGTVRALLASSQHHPQTLLSVALFVPNLQPAQDQHQKVSWDQLDAGKPLPHEQSGMHQGNPPSPSSQNHGDTVHSVTPPPAPRGHRRQPRRHRVGILPWTSRRVVCTASPWML